MARRTRPVQCVADVHAVLGEGPVWVARESRALLGRHQGPEDLPPRRARASSASGRRRCGSARSRRARAAGSSPAPTRASPASTSRPAGSRSSRNPEADLPRNRFNDGKVDRARPLLGRDDGRSRSARRRGTLYRVDPDLTLHRDRQRLQGHQRPRVQPRRRQPCTTTIQRAAGHLRLRPRRRRQRHQPPRLLQFGRATAIPTA